ncbi:MAG: type VII toxin-antitoxin system HepT family RNase toxin [Candidatus Njordarchaeales archaeon]
MKRIPLNKEVLVSRLEEIRQDLEELKSFQRISFEEFDKGYNFAISEHYLRRALEAIFDIGSHILSRIPGARPTTYKEVAMLLGRYEIVPNNFVEEKLVKIAGYRNRLIHFYYEIKEKELYQIIQNNMEDIEKFCSYIKEVVENPGKFRLEVR